MESVFYELYDSYQVVSKAAGAGGCIPRTDDTSEMCRRASEVQHKFLGNLEANDTDETRKAKLLSFLETDCVPVSQQAVPMIMLMFSNLCVPWRLLHKLHRAANTELHGSGSPTLQL